MLKRWAEWFTVIATGSLLPIEAYEIYRHPSALKVLVLLVKVAVHQHRRARVALTNGLQMNESEH